MLLQSRQKYFSSKTVNDKWCGQPGRHVSDGNCQVTSPAVTSHQQNNVCLVWQLSLLWLLDVGVVAGVQNSHPALCTRLVYTTVHTAYSSPCKPREGRSLCNHRACERSKGDANCFYRSRHTRKQTVCQTVGLIIFAT